MLRQMILAFVLAWVIAKGCAMFMSDRRQIEGSQA
jgi:hypothetical protein